MDLQLVRLFGQIGGGKAINILADNVSFPNEEVRHQILLSLAMINYQAPKSKKGEILANIHTEIKNAVWMLAAMVDIREEDQSDLLKRALNYSLFKSRERVLWLLSFIYGSKDVLRAKAALVWGRSEQRSYAMEALGNIISNELREIMEALGNIISNELREIIFPLIEDFPPGKNLEKLNAFFPQNKLSHWERIEMMISRPLDSVSPWIKSCALYLAGQSEDFVETDSIIKCLSSPIPLIRETAVWALHSLDPALLQKRATQLKNDRHPVINHICDTIGENIKMLLTIEKVIILKKIGIFSEVPDKLLVNVASNLKEIELMPGEMIIKKGAIGSSMFIIIDGEVKVHDEDRTLATLSSGEVFGELALLDPEPRSASVTALLETTLLKIEREMLFELLAAHSDVAGGIIKVLCRRVRNATGESIGS